MVDKKEMKSERRKRDWERKWNHAKENKIEREREEDEECLWENEGMYWEDKKI